MNAHFAEQSREAARRWNERETARRRNLRLISSGQALAADTPERVEKFLARRRISAPLGAEVMIGPRAHPSVAVDREAESDAARALERILGNDDLVDRSFFERCLAVARSVGRIWIGVRGGRATGYGTGFLISPRLVMTNNHVLRSEHIAAASQIEMGYESTLSGISATSLFRFRPEEFFFTDPHLDYSVVAVESTSSNGGRLRDFGWNSLVEAEGKTIISQWVNIIQHPNGNPKRYGLRENQIVDMLPQFLHYRTDTAPGSSGSPVYNDVWEVVGLHHAGVWRTNAAGQILARNGQVWREDMGDDEIDWIANEGARISRVVAHLRSQPMNEAESQLFAQAFIMPPADLPPESHLCAASLANLPSRGRSDAFSFKLDVAEDGTINVRLKPGGEESPDATDSTQAPAKPEPDLPEPGPSVVSGEPSGDPESVLARAQTEFAKRSDVVSVRWGYVFKEDWITDEHALVVTVREKKPLAELHSQRVSPLPDRFLGFPIQITNPTAEELLGIEHGAGAIETLRPSQEVLRDEIVYEPPPRASLRRLENERMRVVAHLSPDAGWPELSKFLDAARGQLVVGMYDFGAPHVLAAVTQAGRRRNFNRMHLVMQPGESLGSGTKANDLKDAEVVESLHDALGRKFRNAWVKTGPVNGWVAYSYHIKVAVRDSKAFWLSSGNWQSSNQPDASPLTEDPQVASWLEKYNREWHTVVEHEGLAKTFEKYLLHDYNKNRDYDPSEAMEALALLIPDELMIPDPLERVDEFEYFPPFDEDRNFTVMPLLTPDNYLDEVIAVVESARDELLIQNQTFNPPTDNQQSLKRLMSAVRERQEAGVRLRIIFRSFIRSDDRKKLEGLKRFGIDTRNIRLQKGCHTKGVIADRKKVIIGSHNWSNSGISTNRDASLYFEDEPLAEYFAKVFWHDWKNLARRSIARPRRRPELVRSEAAAKPGMTVVPWKEFVETI